MAVSPTTELEKQSLEAHVDLCALRYNQLDDRLSNLEKKVDTVREDIIEGQKSLTKVIVGTAGTIIASVISIIMAILFKVS